MSKTKHVKRLYESGKVKMKIEKNKIDIRRLKSKQIDEKRKFGIDVYHSLLNNDKDEANRLFRDCRKKVDDLSAKINKKRSFIDISKGIVRESFEVKEDIPNPNAQFGVNPSVLPSTKVEGYEYPIPSLLVTLKSIIKEKDGFSAEGIFRLSADGKEREIVKAKINSGDSSWQVIHDVHVAAKLIGEWFRELPVRFWEEIGQDIVETTKSEEELVKAHKSFPEPHSSIILWLWDLLVEVAEYSDKNKMTNRNLAIVFAPSLFNPLKYENPMLAMGYSGKVQTFCERALDWRSNLKSKKLEADLLAE